MQAQASFAEAVFVALGSLRSSKLRSFLTLLGIILATTTLIAVMSVIHGMDVYIAQTVSDMGATGYRIVRIPMLGRWDPKKFMELQARNPQLTSEEYQFLREHLTLTDQFGMQTGGSATISYERQSVTDVSITGVTPNIGAITNVQPASGRFVSETDQRRHADVAFIGNDLKDQFFAAVDPIGKVISIDGRPFEVIGVAKAQGSAFGQSRDNFVMMPITAFFKIYGSRTGISFAGTALDREHLYRAQDEARMLLRAYRHIRPNQDDNFGLFSSDVLVARWDQITGAIAATAVGVVSVFMVVGGVVIMNIMLAVVTERTHEIGIRKSVGARGRDILNQFLVESSVLAASGGIVGVLFAWITAVLVRRLTPVPTAVPIAAVVVGIGLSATVGLFFGIYPARRAARMDPIEALRVET